MRIAIVGCGYLGAVHAAQFAGAGHHVIGYDIDLARVTALAAGRVPFSEPGLGAQVRTGLSAGLLDFTADADDLEGCDAYFVCVGTPLSTEGTLDLSALGAAIDTLIPVLRPDAIVVGKSTVPPGTAARVAAHLSDRGAGSTQLIWHPEFLREGTALQDLAHPARLVYGLDPDRLDQWRASGADRGLKALDSLAADLSGGLTAPRFVSGFATAELTKLAANAFLATKISFANALAGTAADLGADGRAVLEAVGADPRIGPDMLDAGLGYGGSCLPKDTAALRLTASSGLAGLLRGTEAINGATLQRVARAIGDQLGGLVGRRVAILGGSFKPGSDDERHSPSLALAHELATAGALVAVTDPSWAAEPALGEHAGLGRATSEPFGRLSFDRAIESAEALVLATAWSQYVDLDPVDLSLRTSARLAIDTRGRWHAEPWTAAGWRLVCVP